MEFIQEYLLDDALVVIPVLLILGKIIKETPYIKDWLIPHILLVIGIVFSLFLVGFNVDGVIQGVLVSGASVFGYEIFKNTMERD